MTEGVGQSQKRYGISPYRIANIVAFVIHQPDDTTVNELTVDPIKQPW